MDSDRIKGRWKQLKGRVKEQWAAITDDDLKEAEGHLDYLVGKIQERTGESADTIREKIRGWEKDL